MKLPSQFEASNRQPMPSIEPMPPRPGTLWEVAAKQAQKNQRDHVAPFAPGVIFEADKKEEQATRLEAEAEQLRAGMLADVAAWDSLLTKLERAQECCGRVQNSIVGEKRFAEEYGRLWADAVRSGNYNDLERRSLLCSILAAESAIPRLEALGKKCQTEVAQANDTLEAFAKQHPEHGLEEKLPKKR